jgi:hypothetical protein
MNLVAFYFARLTLPCGFYILVTAIAVAATNAPQA